MIFLGALLCIQIISQKLLHEIGCDIVKHQKALRLFTRSKRPWAFFVFLVSLNFISQNFRRGERKQRKLSIMKKKSKDDESLLVSFYSEVFSVPFFEKRNKAFFCTFFSKKVQSGYLGSIPRVFMVLPSKVIKRSPSQRQNISPYSLQSLESCGLIRGSVVVMTVISGEATFII